VIEGAAYSIRDNPDRSEVLIYLGILTLGGLWRREREPYPLDVSEPDISAFPAMWDHNIVAHRGPAIPSNLKLKRRVLLSFWLQIDPPPNVLSGDVLAIDAEPLFL